MIGGLDAGVTKDLVHGGTAGAVIKSGSDRSSFFLNWPYLLALF